MSSWKDAIGQVRIPVWCSYSASYSSSHWACVHCSCIENGFVERPRNRLSPDRKHMHTVNLGSDPIQKICGSLKKWAPESMWCPFLAVFSHATRFFQRSWSSASPVVSWKWEGEMSGVHGVSTELDPALPVCFWDTVSSCLEECCLYVVYWYAPVWFHEIGCLETRDSGNVFREISPSSIMYNFVITRPRASNGLLTKFFHYERLLSSLRVETR